MFFLKNKCDVICCDSKIQKDWVYLGLYVVGQEAYIRIQMGL